VETEHAVQIIPVAATSTTTQQVDVESEPAMKTNPAASPTVVTLSVITLPNAISNRESGN
jgi:hypothetical protein